MSDKTQKHQGENYISSADNPHIEKSPSKRGITGSHPSQHTSKMLSRKPTVEAVKQEVDEYIGTLSTRLHEINQSIHDHPELLFKEHHAHNTVCDFLEEQGFQVTRHAYGLETAFEARKVSGNGGRIVNFNMEYDALPGIGHACGHNLIATAGLTGFLALAFAIEKFGMNGTVQVLGTPAEEGGGGKIILLDRGAYKDIDVSLMIHPVAEDTYRKDNAIGCAGTTSIANLNITCEFRGAPAHAGMNPWKGVNALDAVVLSYNNVSAMRQQIHADERIHGCILSTPEVANVIPEYTKLKYTARSPTLQGVKELGKRVHNCLEAGGLATGCETKIEWDDNVYADLRINEPLCALFESLMSDYGHKILKSQEQQLHASTDQGNVTYALPSLHGLIGIPTEQGEGPHTHKFATAASKQEAHDRFVKAGKAMAITGWRVLLEDEVYANIKESFEQDKRSR